MSTEPLYRPLSTLDKIATMATASGPHAPTNQANLSRRGNIALLYQVSPLILRDKDPGIWEQRIGVVIP
jgi:hypothetical protein